MASRSFPAIRARRGRSALCAALVALSTLGAASKPIPALCCPALAPLAVAREEFFVLELERPAATEAGRARAPAQVGVSVWRRADGEDVQLECETRFFEERTRVQQFERPDDDAARFVWREWRPNQGRTLRAQWNAATARFDLVEWGRDEPIRMEFEGSNGMLWPLQAIELARTSAEMASPFVWFDPLARQPERVNASVEWRGQAAPSAANEQELVRRLRLTTDDGVCVGEFEFVADALRAYRWQASGLRARRVDAEEYERCLAAHQAELAIR